MRDEFHPRRGDQNQTLLKRRKIQLQIIYSKLIFLFRIFGGGNGFAQGTGMLAVKGPGHGLAERAGLEIVREHRRPGDGLQ